MAVTTIPSDEMRQDIADSKAEIKELRLKIRYLDAKIANATDPGRILLARFSRDAAQQGIAKRKKLIFYIQTLLDAGEKHEH